MNSIKRPALVGVVHLPALPTAPLHKLALVDIVQGVQRDVRALSTAGFDAVIVENFGDAPFEKEQVGVATVAVMTRVLVEAKAAAPELSFGVNVLRNDAVAAHAIALAADAAFVRINVHVGARVTDQGIVEGKAASTLRARRAMGAEHVRIWADVDVKHSAPLAPYPLEQEVEDAIKRGLADAILVTGDGTGKTAEIGKLQRVCKAAGERPVYVGSGVTPSTLAEIRAAGAYGVVVGSCLRSDGKAGGAIDVERAAAFAAAWRQRG